VNASPRRVFLVSSSNYADGLGGAVLAAIDGGNWSPMMLVTPTGLDAGVASFIDKATTIHDGTIMGGSASISTTVDGQLRTHLH
jgi:hypothetical protein